MKEFGWTNPILVADRYLGKQWMIDNESASACQARIAAGGERSLVSLDCPVWRRNLGAGAGNIEAGSSHVIPTSQL